MRKINTKGLELIKHFESLKLRAYKDSVGIWTIGYGHTGASGRFPVYGGLYISKSDAIEILEGDLFDFEKGVDTIVSVETTEDQFSALVSFAFNLGVGNLKSSTLLKRLNASEYDAAANEFKRWSKAGGNRMAGLVRRRLSEENLFRSKDNPIIGKLPNDWKSKYFS